MGFHDESGMGKNIGLCMLSASCLMDILDSRVQVKYAEWRLMGLWILFKAQAAGRAGWELSLYS